MITKFTILSLGFAIGYGVAAYRLDPGFKNHVDGLVASVKSLFVKK